MLVDPRDPSLTKLAHHRNDNRDGGDQGSLDDDDHDDKASKERFLRPRNHNLNTKKGTGKNIGNLSFEHQEKRYPGVHSSE